MEDRKTARRLANAAVEAGRPLEWFETLYDHANGDPSIVPWADLAPNPNLLSWLAAKHIEGHENTALVVGCGLGDDAEALSAIGFDVTAFDISETAIRWCAERFPHSNVAYTQIDLFQTPDIWHHEFAFVFEAYTLQVLPPGLRKAAMRKIADCVAEDGTLLAVSRGRDDADDPGAMPWPLLRQELAAFTRSGLTEIRFDDYIEDEAPPVRRFRVEYRRRKQAREP